MIFRVGQGYDIHRLAPGRALVLGGVTVPAERGAVGHSDADALIHAIIDALLGAAALGDIGAHFPPGDPQYAGISSRVLLRRVRDLLSDRGWSVMNVDSTVIIERPRLAPYRDAMRAAVSEELGITPDAVGVKAKTKEGADTTGAGEAVEAYAAVLLAKEADVPDEEPDGSEWV